MGDVIADLRLPRDGFVVSSKVYFGAVDDPLPTQKGLSRKHVHDACHAALKRLRVDYLDLYYCHRPDPDTPVARSEEHTSELQSLMRISYAVFCWKQQRHCKLNTPKHETTTS